MERNSNKQTRMQGSVSRIMCGGLVSLPHLSTFTHDFDILIIVQGSQLFCVKE